MEEVKVPDESKNEPDEEKSSSNDEWTEIDEDGWENILGSGRLRRRILKSAPQVQDVQRPTKGDYVKISLKGTFEETIFEENEAFEFNCEEGEAIKALDLVVALMYPGETDEIIADPELAYGSFGLPPHLPPNGAIHLEITLLEHLPSSNLEDLPIEKRMETGLRKKDRGNFWFARSEYSMAIQCYSKAVDYFDDDSIELEVPMDRYLLEQPLQDLITEKIKACNNLAQAQLKNQSYEAALGSLKTVLKLEPNNEKALFRKAKALAEKGETELAVGTLRRVTRLYSENKVAQAELQRLLGKKTKDDEKAKFMSKKMLGLDKYEEEQKKKEASQWSYSQKSLFIASVMAFAGIALGSLSAVYSQYK